MISNSEGQDRGHTITDELKALYPNLTDEQILEARDNMDTYIEQSMLQYERIRQDPDAYRKFRALTGRNFGRYDESGRVLPAINPPLP